MVGVTTPMIFIQTFQSMYLLVHHGCAHTHVCTPMFSPLEFQKIKGAQENNAASCTGFLTPHPQHMACKVSSLNSMGVLTPMMHGM